LLLKCIWPTCVSRFAIFSIKIARKRENYNKIKVFISSLSKGFEYAILGHMLQKLIEHLLKNKTESNLVAFFFASPERGFALHELEKRIGSKNLVPTLNSFVKNGVLNTYSKKNVKFYRVNKKYNLNGELREIIQKNARQYEDELVKAAKKLNGVKAVILTGIFVGNTKADCDMVVVGEPNQKALDNFVAGVEKVIGQEVNFALFEERDFNYRKNIFDRFTKDVLENEHIVIDKTK
jgi:hypothetical protein